MTDHDTTQTDLVADQLAVVAKEIRRAGEAIAAELSALAYAAAQGQRPAWERSVYDPRPAPTPDRR